LSPALLWTPLACLVIGAVTFHSLACASFKPVCYSCHLSLRAVIKCTVLRCELQVPLYALNQHLVFKVLQGLDMGGSITIHAFGAYYGLAASLVLSNGRQAPGAYTSANIKNSAT
jgi:ammonia channel protein AmtB